jgi:hypothetical protein
MYSVRWLGAPLLFAVGFCIGGAGLHGSHQLHAGPIGDPPATLLALLAAEEYVPTDQDLFPFGAEAPDLILAVARDTSQDPYIRARAVSALQYYPGHSRAEDYVADLVDQSAGNGPLLRAALHVFAKIAKDRSVAPIARFLSSSDPLLREAAAQALADTQSPHAIPWLERAETSESETFLKQEMNTLTEAMRKRLNVR